MSRLKFFSNALVTFALAFPVFADSPAPGIGNFHQVDARVYRGAQPTEQGFQYLAKVGVKTVIDLRESDGRARKEEQMVTAAGMKYINVPMSGLTPPTPAEISRILDILENDTAGAVFVHCKRGADRTGAVIASYRIDHDGWDNSRALREAMSEGMSFFQLPRQNYIRAFQARTITANASAPGLQQAVPAPAVAQ